MLRIGLSGGTGAGKSTVARLLAGLGAVVVDADALAREVLAPGSAGLAEVVQRFGPDLLAVDGTLDRAALASLVFGDDERRRALEAITHPRIGALTHEISVAAPDDAVLVHDVPLLVEKGMGAHYHLVVIVDAPQDVRVARLVASRGMDPADVRARIRVQATTAQRSAAADVWVDTDRPPAEVDADVSTLWHRRLVPFERNVRTRTPACPPDELGPVPYDERWPARAARQAARLAVVVGPLARDVEHVGPTSVVGGSAPDVVDLALLIGSDAADDVRQRLQSGGYPWVEPGLHVGCDPAEAVRVHVKVQPAGGADRAEGRDAG